ncbi:MAG: hypothetical protein SGPRY_012915 [Prymnesium sp.]
MLLAVMSLGALLQPRVPIRAPMFDHSSLPLMRGIEEEEASESLAAVDDTKGSYLPQGTIPVPFRPLSEQEIVDKFNSMPTFSIVNGADQTLATPDESGELGYNFYLDLDEAQQMLEQLQQTNPLVQLDLGVVPLGTVYALSEWEAMPQSFEEQMEEADRALEAEEPLDAAPSSEASADIKGSGDVRPTFRLRASRAEVEAVGDALDGASAPPALRLRNQRRGVVPLFGSDQIRFQISVGEGGAAQTEMRTPLFVSRADLVDAWVASGGTSESLPELQLTDLRTLAWRMQFDGSQDWRTIMLVASDDAIAFVEQQQAKEPVSPTPQEQGEPSKANLELSKADVQALIFGS